MSVIVSSQSTQSLQRYRIKRKRHQDFKAPELCSMDTIHHCDMRRTFCALFDSSKEGLHRNRVGSVLRICKDWMEFSLGLDDLCLHQWLRRDHQLLLVLGAVSVSVKVELLNLLDSSWNFNHHILQHTFGLCPHLFSWKFLGWQRFDL